MVGAEGGIVTRYGFGCSLGLVCGRTRMCVSISIWVSSARSVISLMSFMRK